MEFLSPVEDRRYSKASMNGFFLADDLSGALEVAAAFRNAGRSVTVTWSYERWGACGPDDVVGFTTETRNAGPAEAAAAVTQALAFGRARGGRLLFKKIDSTMRGPIGAELGAVAAALPGAVILFTPANPHAGRMVRDGVLFVNGVPVAESEFGRDPANPVTQSSIRALIPEGVKTRVVALDVTKDADFTPAFKAREAAGGDWAAVGSGAMVRALVPRFEQAGNLSPARVPWPEPASKAILFVCGSAHPLNRTQAARLSRERQVAISDVDPSAPDRAVRAAAAAIRATGAAVLHVVPRTGATGPDSKTALAAIVRAAVDVTASTGVRRLLVTGGETARALCEAWRIRALRVLGDVEPGLVLASAEGGGDAWLMAIKPGGFGDDATWVRAAEALGQRKN